MHFHQLTFHSLSAHWSSTYSYFSGLNTLQKLKNTAVTAVTCLSDRTILYTLEITDFFFLKLLPSVWKSKGESLNAVFYINIYK